MGNKNRPKIFFNNGDKKDIIRHHVIPKSRSNGQTGIKVKICSIFESTFHFLFWNMTIPEIIAFLIIVMYVCRDKKWSKHKLKRLRVLIINGHFREETRRLEKMFSINSNFMRKHFNNTEKYHDLLPPE